MKGLDSRKVDRSSDRAGSSIPRQAGFWRSSMDVRASSTFLRSISRMLKSSRRIWLWYCESVCVHRGSCPWIVLRSMAARACSPRSRASPSTRSTARLRRARSLLMSSLWRW
ncbi:hypothetical protein D3C85_1402150 [compost metagenome]